jgi:hypothetical protein
MSTKAPNQAGTVRSDVEAFFYRAEAAGFQPRLRTVTGTCQFNLEGAGIWRVAVKDGTIVVIKGESPMPAATCIVSCTAEDFLRIVRQENHMNMMSAVLQEILTIKGDIVFAYAVLGSFVFTPSNVGPQRGTSAR